MSEKLHSCPGLLRRLLSRAAALGLLAALSCGALGYTAWAQTVYVIRDDDQVTTLVAASDTTVSQVLDQAGLEVDAWDVVTQQEQGQTAELEIHRLDLVSVACDGGLYVTRAQGRTAGEILLSLGIHLSARDRLSCAASTLAYDGMHLQVTRVTTRNAAETVCLPHGTMTIQDDTLPLGEAWTEVQGQDGLRTVTWELTLEDGVEVSRRQLGSALTLAPVHTIVHVGTALPAPEPEPENTVTTADGQVYTYSQVLSCQASAYTCQGSSWNTTYTGTTARYGAIAVDPDIIPLGSTLYVLSDDGYCVYGVCTAEDIGGGIQGNTIDLYFDTYDACIQFGRRQCTVYILN